MGEGWVLVAGLAALGALAAGSLALTRPLLALGILFVLASVSRLTLESPVGTMRLEQPAIMVVAAVLVLGGQSRLLFRIPRAVAFAVLAFAVFLGCLALSSALVAPDPISSLRMVAWYAISMVGGGVAFALARRQPVSATMPLAFGGAAKALVGIIVAVAFFIGGAAIDAGIQGSDTIMPRVHAFTWETNLYASFLAMCVPVAIEAARGSRRAVGVAMLVLVVAALPLGETRGAYLGAAAGFLSYVGVRFVLERRAGDLPKIAGLAVGAFLIGVLGANSLLSNPLERPTGDGVLPSDPGPSGTPLAAPSDPRSPTPAATPVPTLAPYPDTVSFRLERVPVALRDLRESPLIGLGAHSFGQRHSDPSQVRTPPDHIAILAVAALYDAGIIGAAALALGFVFVFTGLWRSARAAARADSSRRLGAAAALIGSVVAMLVAYQATNALHFAVNWIVIGGALALTAESVPEATEDPTGSPRA